jgi:hypothetical protein
MGNQELRVARQGEMVCLRNGLGLVRPQISRQIANLEEVLNSGELG